MKNFNTGLFILVVILFIVFLLVSCDPIPQKKAATVVNPAPIAAQTVVNAVPAPIAVIGNEENSQNTAGVVPGRDESIAPSIFVSAGQEDVTEANTEPIIEPKNTKLVTLSRIDFSGIYALMGDYTFKNVLMVYHDGKPVNPDRVTVLKDGQNIDIYDARLKSKITALVTE